MKTAIETTINIQAPISLVWNILSDFEKYPTWSPTIKEFKGIPKEGSRTKVVLSQPGGGKITMNPIFLAIKSNQELRWKGSLLIKGIFDGEHYFLLRETKDGNTELVQGEKFSGILVLFLQKMIHGNTKKGFELFNQAIKDRAEGSNYKY